MQHGVSCGSVVCALVLLTAPAASANYVYWVDDAQNLVQRSRLDGSNVETLIDMELSSFADVALDPAAGMMYWSGDGRIYRSDLDGVGTQVVVDTGSTSWIREIELDRSAGKLYWVDSAIGKIRRANLDGSEMEDVYTTAGTSLRCLALDLMSGMMYWKNSGVIYRSTLEGEDIEPLVTGIENVCGLDLDLVAGMMYWTDTAQDTIACANLDGSDVDVLFTQPAPFGIDVVPELGQVYWTDVVDGVVRRANLDGSGYETIVTGLPRAWGLEVIPEPSTLILLLGATLLLARRRPT